MAYVRLPGGGSWYPVSPLMLVPSLNSTVGLIDATGEKLAIIGRVIWKDNASTKSIRRVQFKFGTIVKAGGSGLTVSLQDVTLSSGPSFQPDGVQDQTVAIANGDASFATDTWYRTGALSADRAAAHNSLLAVVIEFDGSGRLGADSVRLAADNSIGSILGGGIAQFTATWSSSALAVLPNIILEADDGTIGTLGQSSAYATAANDTSFNNSSNPDEYALAFTLPFSCKVDAIWMQVQAAANTSNFDLCLYKGTTQLASVSFDANAIAQIGSSKPAVGYFDDVEVERNVEHLISLKPTATGSVLAYALTVNDASHWDIHPGGQSMRFTSRVDAGSWNAATTTKRLLGGFRISQSVEANYGISINNPLLVA